MTGNHGADFVGRDDGAGAEHGFGFGGLDVGEDFVELDGGANGDRRRHDNYADFLEGYNQKDRLKAASSLENGNP
jgi:hypothetical protein